MQHILNRWKSMSSRCLVGTVACTLLVLVATPAAFGQHGLIADNSPAGDKEDLQPSFSETAVDRSGETTCCDPGCCLPCCPSRWTASADFIIFDRIGSVPYTLVETVPHSVPSAVQHSRHGGAQRQRSPARLFRWAEARPDSARRQWLRPGVVLFSDRRLERLPKHWSHSR